MQVGEIKSTTIFPAAAGRLLTHRAVVYVPKYSQRRGVHHRRRRRRRSHVFLCWRCSSSSSSFSRSSPHVTPDSIPTVRCTTPSLLAAGEGSGTHYSLEGVWCGGGERIGGAQGRKQREDRQKAKRPAVLSGSCQRGGNRGNCRAPRVWRSTGGVVCSWRSRWGVRPAPLGCICMRGGVWGGCGGKACAGEK